MCEKFQWILMNLTLNIPTQLPKHRNCWNGPNGKQPYQQKLKCYVRKILGNSWISWPIIPQLATAGYSPRNLMNMEISHNSRHGSLHRDFLNSQTRLFWYIFPSHVAWFISHFMCYCHNDWSGNCANGYKSMYLNGKLNEEIYMQQPNGFNDGTGCVCWLWHTLYGLKQSGQEWNKTLSIFLKSIGFTKLVTENCVFIQCNNDKFNIICHGMPHLHAPNHLWSPYTSSACPQPSPITPDSICLHSSVTPMRTV